MMSSVIMIDHNWYLFLPVLIMSSSNNSMIITFIVNGKPIPLARHRRRRVQRSSSSGGTGKILSTEYNPSAQQMRAFANACALHMPKTPLHGSIVMKLKFYFERPKSHYKKKSRIGIKRARSSGVLEDEKEEEGEEVTSEPVLSATAPMYYTKTPGKVNWRLIYSNENKIHIFLY